MQGRRGGEEGRREGGRKCDYFIVLAVIIFHLQYRHQGVVGCTGGCSDRCGIGKWNIRVNTVDNAVVVVVIVVVVVSEGMWV